MKWRFLIGCAFLIAAGSLIGCSANQASQSESQTPAPPVAEAQPAEDDPKRAEPLWDAFLQAGFKVDQPLDFNYYFYTVDRSDAERVEKHFEGKGFKIKIGEPVSPGSPYNVILSKQEKMTREGLVARYAEFDKVARDLGILSFDGAEAAQP